MAALSLLGYNLPQGLTLTKGTSENMTTSATNHQENINLSKTFSKITVQNVLGENTGNAINISNNNNINGSNGSPIVNNANAIVRKIKDFGMVGAVNNAGDNTSKSLLIRKRPLVDAKCNGDNNSKPPTPAAKKPKQSKEPATPKIVKKPKDENLQRPRKALNALNFVASGGLTPKPAGTPGRKGLPLPQAVARRNARERNRVKQVNNGFAALRERIPEEVAEAFEAQGSARGNSAKKLSKVETLRMAVEYIRSLERLLGFEFTMGGHDSMGQSSSGDDSYSLIKDEFDTLSPSMDDNFEDSMSNYDMEDYFSTTTESSKLPQTEISNTNMHQMNSMDLLPNITTLHGLQYIRIPGTNTYQLLTPDIFVGTTHSPPNSSLDDEQFNSLIDTNCLSPSAVCLTTSPANTANAANSLTTATPAINTATATAAAPASPNTARLENGERVSNALAPAPAPAPLSRLSPVPTTTSSPVDVSSSSSTTTSLYHQQARVAELPQPATLSPAINEHSSSACATHATEVQRQFVAPTLPHLLPHLIKQEYNETRDFVTSSSLKSPSSAIMANRYPTSTIGNQQQQKLLLEHATLSMSPPLDRCNRLLITSHHASALELQSFYDQDDSGSFYEHNLSFKKDFDDVLLDASSATNAGLSDESMIESIDWWEAHTPQSEGGGASNGGGGVGGGVHVVGGAVML